MKVTLSLTLVLSLLLILSAPVIAQADSQSPEEVVAATYEAINAGDIEAYMSLFADNAVATVGPWAVLAGKDEIRASAQETFDASITFEFEILEVDGAKVKVWSSHTPPGYEFPLEATEMFVVTDGKIIYNSWDPTDETMALLQGPSEVDDQTGTQTPEEIVAATYDAINAGDLEAYMSLYADDAVATIGPWQTLVGQDELRPFAQQNFDAGAQMDYEIESVANGLVTVLSSLTSDEYGYPLVANEKFVICDGKIVYNPWDPTAETMSLLAPPEFDNHTLQGVYGILIDGVFLATEDDAVDTRFAISGAFVSDGEGNITDGARTLDFAGDIQSDIVDGTYTVAKNGTATLTFDAYQEDELAATEELSCFVASDGSELECIVTAVSVPAETGMVAAPVVGTAKGMRLAD